MSIYSVVSQIILKECVAVYNKIPQSGFLTSLHRTIWRAIKVQGVLETLTPPQTVCVWLVFYIVSIPNLFPLNFGIRKEASYIHGKGKEEAPSFEELQSDYQHFEWRVIGSNVKELGDDLKLHITLLDSISWEMVTEALWTPSLS